MRIRRTKAVASLRSATAVQEAGGVFGPILIFESGPRGTDAGSAPPVMLFKVTAAPFSQICRTQPEVATPVWLALGRKLATRIRTDGQHRCERMAPCGAS